MLWIETKKNYNTAHLGWKTDHFPTVSKIINMLLKVTAGSYGTAVVWREPEYI